MKRYEMVLLAVIVILIGVAACFGGDDLYRLPKPSTAAPAPATKLDLGPGAAGGSASRQSGGTNGGKQQTPDASVKSPKDSQAHSPASLIPDPIDLPEDRPGMLFPDELIVWSAVGCKPCRRFAKELHVNHGMETVLRYDRPAWVEKIGSVPVFHWKCPNGKWCFIANWTGTTRDLAHRVDQGMRENLR